MVEELYTIHGPELRRYCYAMCRDRAATEDLLQEVYMRALTHIPDLEPLTTSERRAWLYKTARNLFFDLVRRASVARQKTELFGEETDEVGFAEIETAMILAKLPYDLRVLFRQRYFEGYNSSELAKMYGVPAATIRSRLSQARKALREYMKDTI